MVIAGFKDRWRVFTNGHGDYWWVSMDGHGRWIYRGCVCHHHGPLKEIRRHVR
jgi:hypothetical protein